MAVPNRFMVGVNGRGEIFIPCPSSLMTGEDALNLAAHIIALADPDFDLTPRLLEEIWES